MLGRLTPTAQLGWISIRARGGALVALIGASLGFVAAIAFGVASGLPGALDRAELRADQRLPIERPIEDGSEPSLGRAPLILVQERNTVWRGHHIRVVEIAAEPGADLGATVPPGLDTLPLPGMSFISPGLAALLDADPGGLNRGELEPRIGTPAGQIGLDGLVQPAELFAYVGRPTEDLRDSPAALRLDRWGVEDGTRLFRGELHRILSVPLALMVLVPAATLAGRLITLGGRARHRRIAVLHSLGASRTQIRTMDVVQTGVPVAAGLVIARAFRPVVNPLLMEFSGTDRLLLPDDLPIPLWQDAALLALLLAVLISGTGKAVRTRVGEQRGRRWMLVALAPLALGAGLIAMQIVRSDFESPLRNPALIFSTAAVILLLAIAGSGAVTNFLIARSPHRRVSSWHSARRIDRSAWGPTTAATFVLAGSVIGTTFAVMAVVAKAAETDGVLWNRSLVDPGVVYVAGTPSQISDLMTTMPTSRLAPVLQVVSGDSWDVYISCDGVRDLIDVVGDVQCGSTYRIIDSRSDSRTSLGADSGAGSSVAGLVAPSSLTGGPDTLVEVIDRRQLNELLADQGRESDWRSAYAVLHESDPEAIEQLRNSLWGAGSTVEISGSTEVLGSVVAVGDLDFESRQSERVYTPVLLLVLIVALAVLLLDLIGARTQAAIDDQASANSLALLGAEPSLIVRSSVRTGLVAVIVGGVAAAATGTGMGWLYFAFAGYPGLESWPRHALLSSLAMTGAMTVAFAAVVVVSSLIHLRNLRV